MKALAHPPHLKGGDFSHYQSNAVFQSAIKGMKWASCKATEGTTYTDPTFHSRWKELGHKVASGKMKLRVAYAFLHPGNGKAQANHFLKAVGVHGKLPAGTRLALDWEASALNDPKALHDAAARIHDVTGTWPLVYCSDSQVSRARHIVPHAPIWDAKWSGPAPKNVKFVQSSDGPGYDHDYFQGTVAQLEKFAGFKKKPAHPPQPDGLTAADKRGNQVIAHALKDGPLSESGQAARYMKRMLDLAGLNAGTGTAFDKKATRALEQFQSAQGLSPTGELNQKTFNRLKGVELHLRKDPKTFVVGQKNADVAHAEHRLSVLGYHTGKHDGVWDRKDAAALKAFKADERDKDRTGALGTKVRGQLAQETKALGHHAYRVRREKTAGHVRLDALTQKAVAKADGLAEGTKGRAVINVQAHLKAAGFAPKHTGGVFDERTAGAVKAFQRQSGLPVTGAVDAKTWKALKATYLYKKTAPMAKWEHSGQVKALEKDLHALGYKKVGADGLFDQNTVHAVKAFEKKHHLKADGVVTAAEAKRIDQAAHAAGGGKKALALAHSLLGQNVEHLKYHGPLKGLLDTWVSNHVCCANFVSAVYQKVGIFTKGMHEDAVVNLASELRHSKQFQAVSLAHAKPGDIVCFTTPGGHHTELFNGWDHGRPTFIGSNNVNADGSQRISVSHTRYPIIGVFHYKG